METIIFELLKEYGYIILFILSIFEGELGLIFSGIMCFQTHMSLEIAIPIAILGGFLGDQIFFLIGRRNKKNIHNYLKKHKRKLALTHLLLKKYGIWLIFFQRYIYGMRSIIPLAIGLTKYSSRKFILVNLLSAMIWATSTILLAFFYGAELLSFFHSFKEIILFLIFSGILFLFVRILKKFFI